MLKCTEQSVQMLLKMCSWPHFEEELITDIANGKFSILLDESNDISVTKILGVSIIYYSNSSNKVESTYLGLVELVKCDADGIVEGLKKLLTSRRLNINNCLPVGTDSASVLVGVNNGVHAKLKQENSSLILIKCLCHSLQLAVLHASHECLPRNLEFLIAETHNWFSKSAVRQCHYKELYKTINEGSTPLKIPFNCKTRWLSFQTAVERIVNQWLELKTHFQMTRGSEKCNTAEILLECTRMRKFWLFFFLFFSFLFFWQPILNEIQRTSKIFDSKHADQVKCCSNLLQIS